ncbi:MAG: hypothetical protein ABIV50_00915 [Opitutus sp.]
MLQQAIIAASAEEFGRIRVGRSAGAALVLSAGLLFLLGLFPSCVLRVIE